MRAILAFCVALIMGATACNGLVTGDSIAYFCGSQVPNSQNIAIPGTGFNVTPGDWERWGQLDNPSHVVVSYGYNDANKTNIDVPAYALHVAAAVDLEPQAQWYWTNVRLASLPEDRRDEGQEVNYALGLAAQARPNLHIVDYNSAAQDWWYWTNGPGTGDNIHPTGAGCQAWAQMIQEAA